MTPLRITQLSHRILQPSLQAGDIAIDATCGNGHDTLFLSKSVGPTGTVYAFDIQQRAIQKTTLLLQEHPNNATLHLIQKSHEHLSESIPANHHGKINVALFNLGYLPGAEKNITTTKTSTLPALNTTLHLLAKHGILSITLYPGHPKGLQESQAIQQWIHALPQKNYTLIESRNPIPNNGPYLILITKK